MKWDAIHTVAYFIPVEFRNYLFSDRYNSIARQADGPTDTDRQIHKRRHDIIRCACKANILERDSFIELSWNLSS